MALSRDWTVKKIAGQALRDLVLPLSCRSYQERVDIINRAVGSFFSSYLPMVSHAYFTPAAIAATTAQQTDTASITAGVMTFTAITLAASDVGSQFVLVVSGTPYAGYITSVTSTSTAAVSMLQAPADGSSGTIYLFPPQTATTASLAGLRIARLGAVSYGYLSSNVVPDKAIRFLEYDHFLGFRDSWENQNTIAYTILGDTMYLAKGSNLSSYGTLTYVYPRLPVPVAGDTDYLDIPDGAAAELVLMKIEEVFARREGKAVPVFNRELSLLMGTFREEMDAINTKARKTADTQMRRTG